MATAITLATVAGSNDNQYEIKVAADNVVYCTHPHFFSMKPVNGERVCKHMRRAGYGAHLNHSTIASLVAA